MRDHDSETPIPSEFCEDIQELKRELETMNRAIHTRLGAQDQKIAELGDEISRRPSIGEIVELIEPKTNKEIFNSTMERKANRGEVDLQISRKADSELVEDIIQTLQNKADISDFDEMKKYIDEKMSTGQNNVHTTESLD
jgi:repressor of nif and glnA expression